MSNIKIGKRELNSGRAPYIIAEIGANHNGSMDLARRLIDAAADAGADAAKFQSWSDRSIISKSVYSANLKYSDTKRHFGSLKEMVRRYQLTPAQHYKVAEHCNERGIAFCSTPFSSDEVDLLIELEVPFIKVASMDINNYGLLRYIARKNLPVVMSTGMASLSEIDDAVHILRSEGCSGIVLLHCVSIYPPKVSTVNLKNIPMLADAFDIPVGFSDHTIGTHIPLAAVALGACMIEKHFTLDKNLEGWDHQISCDPQELVQIVRQSAEVIDAMGTTRRIVSEEELTQRLKFRRSAVARKALKAGHILSESDLEFKRPGTGIPPARVHELLGRSLRTDISADDIILLDMLV